MKSKYYLPTCLKTRKDVIYLVGGPVVIGDKKIIIGKKYVNSTSRERIVTVYYVKPAPTGVTDNWVSVTRLQLYRRGKSGSYSYEKSMNKRYI